MDKFALPEKYKGTEANVWSVVIIEFVPLCVMLMYFCFRVEFIQLALETKPLNLGQGFPDDLVPDYVPKTLAEVANESVLNNQYTRGFVS